MDDIVSGTIFEFLQYFSLAFAILSVFFIVKRFRYNNQWFWDIPILLLLGHIIVYYVYIVIVRFTPLDSTIESLTFWSSALRFHEVATLLIVSTVNYIKEIKKWGKK
jgi:hypothetical protein